MRTVTIAALSTLFSLLVSCGDPPRVTAIKPPPSKLVCQALPARPAIPAEYAIDWSKVATVDAARVEHEAFVATLRTRDRTIAGHIVAIEGAWFSCSGNLAFVRDFMAQLP